MAIRRHHVIHVGVVLAVLLQLSFAGLFLVDAVTANTTYDALAAHHVAVRATVLGCNVVYYRRTYSYTSRQCYVRAAYQGQVLHAYVPANEPTVLEVDPLDPATHMTEAGFDHGPEEITGDEILTGVLLGGATVVTVVHQLHLRRARRRRGLAHGYESTPA